MTPPMHIVTPDGKRFYHGGPRMPGWKQVTAKEYERIKSKLKPLELCHLCVKNLEGSKP